MVRFVGIDPGLSAPAVCVLGPAGGVASLKTIRSRLLGQERVARIIAGVMVELAGPCLVAIEGYAYSRNLQGARPAVEAVGALKHALWSAGIEADHSIGPMTLRKYVTGRGRHGGRDDDKRAMMEAARSAGVSIIDDNQADAWGLATILRDAYLLATEGRRPGTLFRHEVCQELVPWIREQIRRLERGESA